MAPWLFIKRALGQADSAPSHIARDTVAESTVLTHLPLRGQRRNRGSTVYKCAHSPASLFHSVDPWVTEHLEQAAKVSGLGVERQLKLALHLNHPTAGLLYPYRY